MLKKVILFLLIILVLVLGGYVLLDLNQQGQSTNNVENDISSLNNQVQNNVFGTGNLAKLEDLERYNKEADSNYITIKDTEGLSFMYPNNWTKIEKDNTVVYMSQDGKGAIVSLSKDNMDTAEAYIQDFDSYMAFQKIYIRQNMTLLSDINEKQVNLNGYKAYIINYITEVDEQEANSTLNVTQAVFADDNEIVHIMTLFVLNDYAEEYQPIFEKIIKSFILEK